MLRRYSARGIRLTAATTILALLFTLIPASPASAAPLYSARWLTQSPYPKVAVGGIATASVTFVNMGTATWQRGTATEARLGINGDDRTLHALGMAVDWVLPDRPAVQNERSVAPGALATFTLKLKGVQRGTFQLHLRPVIDGITWMEDYGVFLYVFVTDPEVDGRRFSSTFERWASGQFGSVSLRVDGSNAWLDLGFDEVATFSVIWKNTSDVAWRRGTATEARLGIVGDDTSFQQAGIAVNWTAPNRPATQHEPEVAPGESATFILQFKGKLAHVVPTIALQPVIDGVAWVSSEPISLTISVAEQRLTANTGSRGAQCGSGPRATSVSLDLLRHSNGGRSAASHQAWTADFAVTPVGGAGTVTWILEASSKGELRVYGCEATYVAPTISYVDACVRTATIKVVMGAPVEAPAPWKPAPIRRGEGGPVDAGFQPSASHTLQITNPNLCYGGPGVTTPVTGGLCGREYIYVSRGSTDWIGVYDASGYLVGARYSSLTVRVDPGQYRIRTIRAGWAPDDLLVIVSPCSSRHSI